MNLIHRLIYWLTSYWLTNADLACIKSNRESILRKKEIQVRDEAKREMGGYLELMGLDFQLELEQQDHVSYILSNEYDQPKPLTLQELREKKGR